MREGKFRWTPEHIETLKRMLERGFTYRQIGTVLGISHWAVSGKVARLGLRQRTQITSGRFVGLRAKLRETPLQRDIIAEAHEKKIAMIAKAPPPPVVRRTSIEPCSYVLQLKPTPIYCEVPSEPGKSMCKKHHDLCFRPASAHHDRLSAA